MSLKSVNCSSKRNGSPVGGHFTWKWSDTQLPQCLAVFFYKVKGPFGQFSPARTVFLYLFSAALSSISDIVLFASFDFVIFFVVDFSLFFPSRSQFNLRHRFFLSFVSLLLASHSFRLTICGWFCSFNSNLLRRSTLINLTPSSRYLSTGRRSNLCANLCRHTGQVVLYKKGRCLYVRK